MKIFFFGTPDFVIPVLETLLKTHEVIAVVTAPDHFDNKRKQTIPSPVKSFYQHYYETHAGSNQYHPLPIFTPEKLSTFKAQLSTLEPDLFVVAAYGKIIPKAILAIPVLGALNIHPSLLPNYRGPSPVPAAILNGDQITGVSIIKMDEQMDHGPILASEPEPILETDTFETLVKRLFAKGATMLPKVIENYASGAIPLVPQDETQATYTRIITRQDGYIDLNSIDTNASGNPNPIASMRTPLVNDSGQARNMSSNKSLEIKNLKLKISRMIRAYYPWPGVWTKVRSRNQEVRIKLLPATALRNHEMDEAIPLEAKQTSFLIQPEGKKLMTIKDFLNGYPEVKEQLESIFKN